MKAWEERDGECIHLEAELEGQEMRKEGIMRAYCRYKEGSWLAKCWFLGWDDMDKRLSKG